MLDHAGTVKLVDFGSAKVAGLAEIATPVAREHLLGTKNYAALEYLLGQTGTHRSDIYALGVTAYELLAGVSDRNRSSRRNNASAPPDAT